MEWYRRDKEVVAAALRRGERPDVATTMASGPLDELVALHEDLGIFGIVEQLEVQRKRAGVADELLLRTLATLPFVEQASLSGAAEVLFREPAVLLQRWPQSRSAQEAMDGIGIPRDGKRNRCRVMLIRCAMRCGG